MVSVAGPDPSVDQIADAVVRATLRAGGSVAGPTAPSRQRFWKPPDAPAQPPTASSQLGEPRVPTQTGPISPAGPLHRILEGTIVDTVLTNRLDGGSAAPVNCLLTNAVYSHSGHRVVIPAGARILGETKAVQTFGETRLAVAFHRLLMPDGSTFSLDRPLGLDQIGDAGFGTRSISIIGRRSVRPQPSASSAACGNSSAAPGSVRGRAIGRSSSRAAPLTLPVRPACR